MSLVNLELTSYLDLLPNELMIEIMKYLGHNSSVFFQLNEYNIIYEEFIRNLQKGYYPPELIFTPTVPIVKNFSKYSKTYDHYYISINNKKYETYNNIIQIFDRVSSIYDKLYNNCLENREYWTPLNIHNNSIPYTIILYFNNKNNKYGYLYMTNFSSYNFSYVKINEFDTFKELWNYMEFGLQSDFLYINGYNHIFNDQGILKYTNYIDDVD